MSAVLYFEDFADKVHDGNIDLKIPISNIAAIPAAWTVYNYIYRALRCGGCKPFGSGLAAIGFAGITATATKTTIDALFAAFKKVKEENDGKS